jgi:uncharacterized protein YndB with AHSA1/START domain
MSETAANGTLADGQELTIVREFDASRERVFKCFVDPEQLIKFWGPIGTHVPLESLVLEPWPGGRFEYVMVADDGSGSYPQKAVFTEVTEPEVWAFTEPDIGMISTGRFYDLGDGRTRLEIHQQNVPAMYATPEALAGFNTSLDRLAEYVRSL